MEAHFDDGENSLKVPRRLKMGNQFSRWSYASRASQSCVPKTILYFHTLKPAMVRADQFVKWLNVSYLLSRHLVLGFF